MAGSRSDQLAQPQRQLSLFDSTCIIVGIIVGAGIFRTAPHVAKAACGLAEQLSQWLPGGFVASGWAVVLLLWLVGGLLSLLGALCYAELATALPREGGDYVYLSRAYGPWAGFLFGWLQLVVVRPADVATMAFIFADYTKAVLPESIGDEVGIRLMAALPVVVFTAINVAGVKTGKNTQNVLTVAKALGLLAVVVAAFVGSGSQRANVTPVDPFPIFVGLVLVLFTYGGWNEMAYVAAEVKRPERNITRALVLGTLAVTVLYLLVNAAYLHALGPTGLAATATPATDTVATVLPRFGQGAVTALVCVSALGAMNGLIFTGARILYALGSDYRLFRALGRWDARRGTPVIALLTQCALTLLLIILLGSFLETVLYYSAVVYTFYLATALAVVVLRFKEPSLPRPYRVTTPLVPLVFAIVCGLLVYSCTTHKPILTACAFGLLFLGVPVYFAARRYERIAKDSDQQPV